METPQANMLISLENAKEFLEKNATALAGVLTTGAKQELDEAIVDLGGHATDQNSTLITAKGATQKQASLRTILIRDHMAPINRAARLRLAGTPELAPFLMPRGNPGTIKLAALATGMAKAAIPYTAIFVAAGLQPDFVTQLETVAGDMVQSRKTREQTTAQRTGVTVSLKTTLSKGRKIVDLLDTFVRTAAQDNPGLLANWKAVKRVANRSSKPAAASPAPAVASPAVAPPAVAPKPEVPPAAASA